ncbi:TauD/TfdA family dioxygenase [Streptomyces sp. NPDC026589]|uniref:TauD/TfdA family dioxygenase n=1 Tax=Streptomyces sp. NPDC026589 TaxID=3155609 RepID=UPI0033E78A14
MPTPLITPAASGTRQMPGFTTVPAGPIEATAWSLPDVAVRRRIADSYRSRGYAIVHVPNAAPSAEHLGEVATALHLGEVFTPPLYTTSSHTAASGVSRLTAASGGDHPFQDRAGQQVHCDATLQDLGQIPTTLMLCVSAAASGGVSFLVNLVDAYAELRRVDPEAAEQLAHDSALVRTSTFASGRSTSGPAFARDADGSWITRYSRTATDTYHATSGGEAAMERALAFLDAAAQPGSAFRTDFTLKPGQALILANDRLGHGRTAFRDNPTTPRLLLRALHTLRPLA